ncbi:MAG: hypothetical protein UU73_C0002G0184 [Candidatus Daviesbacteria bacterium GW2011_GWA1_41_61]|uniref:Uncharacterized protein n=1 Tax=Candidatus Daviesbacteria bacterium GW2011_GWA2_40_9 TaxID=1618424 RepID=A0A0G0X749_9BACT|nr:MAG: hypothetical protein UU26_C0009G0017 [Candidatus Daviesbacteria bacterium GW2011_GWC1_40_9]KKR83462.1 MAG: hypothetical protein UU29_C0005G0043 [Candidatus Daviesbacteria bacterium GW2011_GWA2_40_9]KKR93844.1 MAG: hypothetical protein UU44_C0001G0184 [Candidatus Daviesbacteria bacterium GW2011_GWB1_41_15]KKS15310.1 MAG: hypothetical protein UU73_C0002G0184 [Candidatus Daviesbacteria bacterium GW2011_GWA1_41_61]
MGENKVEEPLIDLEKPEESIQRVYDEIQSARLSPQVKRAVTTITEEARECIERVARLEGREMAGSLDSKHRPTNEVGLDKIRWRMGW